MDEHSVHYSQLHLSSKIINESSPAWSNINHDSYLVQLTLKHKLIQIINTQQDRHLREHQVNDPYTVLHTITKDPQSLPVCVDESFGFLEEEIGTDGISQILDFLRGFISKNPLGTSRVPMIEVVVIEEEVTDVEGYLLEFNAGLDLNSDREDAMKLVKYTKAAVNRCKTCPICLVDFIENGRVVKTGCSHYFHKKCIGIWTMTKTTCPMCRSNVR